jgi:Tol biopolymer transport system component
VGVTDKAFRIFLLCSLVSCLVAWDTVAATALPAGRVYEMVSPLYKGGYGVAGESASVATNGDRVQFNSLGGFAGILSGSGTGGNAYLARREESGWSTEALQPPFGSVADLSETLDYTLGNGTLAPNAGAAQNVGTVDEFQLHNNLEPNSATSWAVVGMPLEKVDGKPLEAIEEGASGDFCHIIVGETEGPLLQVAVNTSAQIYDLSRGCDGTPPSLRLVASNNQEGLLNRSGCAIETTVGAGAGLVPGEQESKINPVADDGREIFFSTIVNKGVGVCGAPRIQLFVRLGGERTVEVSRPLQAGSFGGCGEGGGAAEIPGEVPCPGATSRANSYFKGASEDGSRVFFTTAAKLVSGDTDTGSDLYLANIGCPESEPTCDVAQRRITSLVQVSASALPGESADVLGVSRIAPDGSRIYFVARGVLTGMANENGQKAVKGADNLYFYDFTNGALRFISDLCSGPELSGSTEDVQCPHDLNAVGQRNDTELWGSVIPEAQSAGQDAHILVFSTYAKLLSNDTDNARDIYRYDADTETLERVSVGESGFGANGNSNDTSEEPNRADAGIRFGHIGGDAHVLEQHELRTRAVTERGTQIVFTTSGALSPRATNGLVNVYEWNEGKVSLISTGTAEQSDRDAVIVPDGRDLFFTTSQGLVREDTDGFLDVYDARVNGGFGSVSAPRQPCQGDACQGPLTNPAPLLVPGSMLQAPGDMLQAPGDEFGPAKKSVRKAKTKKKRRTVRKRKHRSKSSRHRGGVANRARGGNA